MCECGHKMESHASMAERFGPCMKCNCSGFVPEHDEDLTDLPDPSEQDLEKLRAELQRTVEELSHEGRV